MFFWNARKVCGSPVHLIRVSRCTSCLMASAEENTFACRFLSTLLALDKHLLLCQKLTWKLKVTPFETEIIFQSSAQFSELKQIHTFQSRLRHKDPPAKVLMVQGCHCWTNFREFIHDIVIAHRTCSPALRAIQSLVSLLRSEKQSKKNSPRNIIGKTSAKTELQLPLQLAELFSVGQGTGWQPTLRWTMDS